MSAETEHRGLLTKDKVKQIQKACQHKPGEEHRPALMKKKRKTVLRWCQTCGYMHEGNGPFPERGFGEDPAEAYSV